jgi:hypothetical protein
MHKSTPQFKSKSGILDDWQKIYGKLAGNEIHSILIDNSKIFREYVGRPFSEVSYEVHEKYNFCLIGVSTKQKQYKHSIVFSHNYENETKVELEGLDDTRTIVINPGNEYSLLSDDICFYISLNKEEKCEWKNQKSKKNQILSELNDLVIHGPELSSRRIIADSKIHNKTENSDLLDMQITELNDPLMQSFLHYTELRHAYSTGDIKDAE